MRHWRASMMPTTLSWEGGSQHEPGCPCNPTLGYPTRGSFGSWASEHKLNLVTYEFEAASPYDLQDRRAPVLIEVLTGEI